MLEITTDTLEDALLITLKGRVDASATKSLEEHVFNTIAEGNINLVLECSEMNYISSAGLRSFLLTAKKIKEVKGTLRLCALAPAVKEVFDISGFSQLFTIYADLDDIKRQ